MPVDTSGAGIRTPRANRTRFLLMIADPDDAVASTLEMALVGHHIDVVTVADGAEALLRAGMLQPDAILVAGSVPPLGASTIVEAVQRHTGTPVLVGVGAADAAEAVAALAAGATACVARPYRTAEILPLLRSIVPGITADFEAPVRAGALQLDPAAMEVTFRGRRMRLPLREFQLLHLLMSHADKVLTREQIVRLLWGGLDNSNTVNVHIKRLRARLGDDPHNPEIILSVRGMGYRLIPPRAATDED